MKLDYKIQSPEERRQLVEQILAENPEPSRQYLETLADYLVFSLEKEERKQKKIITENRRVTVDKRETSFEGLVSHFENGEDGVYNLIANDRHALLTPKIAITKQDFEDIPLLNQLRDSINYWENKMPNLSGRDAYIAKQTLIELRKDQYVIKNAYKKPIVPQKITHSPLVLLLDEKITVKNGRAYSEGVSLLNPKICSVILCNYSKLKQDSYDNFVGDAWYLINDFENICDIALASYPLYQTIVENKIDGVSNLNIQRILQEQYNKTYSIEYISNLWRHKIPNLIAETAEEQYLQWHYTKHQKPFKVCRCCGVSKPMSSKFFNLNCTSYDGFYSVCKKCRRKNLVKIN